jgi:hypothetical protein
MTIHHHQKGVLIVVYALTLPTYRAILDKRHEQGMTNVVPIERLLPRRYNLQHLGTYGAAVIIETDLSPNQYALQTIQVIRGRNPVSIPNIESTGLVLALDSSVYYFFDKITLLITCDMVDNLKIELLGQQESDIVRHAYLLSKTIYILRSMRSGYLAPRLVKFGRYLVGRLEWEYPVMDAATKKRLSEIHNEHWSELCDLFNTYVSGPHVKILWLLNGDKLVKWK